VTTVPGTAPVVPELETERLILRPWRDADRAAFAAMNGDPEVRRFFPSVMTREEAGTLLDRLIAEQGRELVFAAVEAKTGGLVGMAGLAALDENFSDRPGDRDRLAACASRLGPGLCHRGGAGLARPRLRDLGTGRDRCLRRPGECAFAGGDGAAGDAARCGGRFRPSRPAG